ncbi:MAG: polyisoprenoid-binding protein [Oceanococcus sp.]|nr:MAG: polyisoprenoid-binding protein [Oceanococcus sp.]
MNTLNRICSAALLAVAVATPAQAADKYKFDTVHSQVIFFVSHLGFSMSEGEFLDFDGGFSFDQKNWGNSSVDVTIKTASISLDDKKWDDHMKNEDFFNVEKYPTMTFKSTKVESKDGKTGTITGDLTLLGVTKPVTLDVTFNKAGAHPFNPKKQLIGFSATGTLKRSEFGMKYALPAVGDEVEIRIEVEAEKI